MRRSQFCRPSSTFPVFSHPGERSCGQTNHVRAARKLPLCSSQLLRSNMISRDDFNCEYRTRTGAIWSHLLSLREPHVPVSNSVGSSYFHRTHRQGWLQPARHTLPSFQRGQRSELICPFRAVAAGGMKQLEKKVPTPRRLAQISEYDPTRSVRLVTAAATAVRERLTRPAHVCVHVAHTPKDQSSTPSAFRQEWDFCIRLLDKESTEEGMKWADMRRRR